MGTKIFLAVIAALLLVYDGVCAKFGQPSESTVIRNLAFDYVVLTAVIGSIVGHWFLPGIRLTQNSAFGYCVPLWAVLLIWDILYNYTGLNWWVFQHLGIPAGHVWYRHPMIWFAIGVLNGALLWGAD